MPAEGKKSFRFKAMCVYKELLFAELTDLSGHGLTERKCKDSILNLQLKCRLNPHPQYNQTVPGTVLPRLLYLYDLFG